MTQKSAKFEYNVTRPLVGISLLNANTTQTVKHLPVTHFSFYYQPSYILNMCLIFVLTQCNETFYKNRQTQIPIYELLNSEIYLLVEWSSHKHVVSWMELYMD